MIVVAPPAGRTRVEPAGLAADTIVDLCDTAGHPIPYQEARDETARRHGWTRHAAGLAIRTAIRRGQLVGVPGDPWCVWPAIAGPPPYTRHRHLILPHPKGQAA